MPKTVTTSGTVAFSPSKQAYAILHWSLVLVPAIAGLDKFSRVLADWDAYLAPSVARLLPLPVRETMVAVGVLEVLVAIAVAVRPRIGAYVLSAWVAATVVDLALGLAHLDVALFDLGLVLGALALGRLAQVYDHPGVIETRTVETTVTDDAGDLGGVRASRS